MFFEHSQSLNSRIVHSVISLAVIKTFFGAAIRLGFELLANVGKFTVLSVLISRQFYGTFFQKPSFKVSLRVALR